MNNTLYYNNCQCMEKSRLDPMGNIIKLYTCKECLEKSLELFRYLACKSEGDVLQLELFTDVRVDDSRSQEQAGFVHSSYSGQDGPPEAEEIIHG